MSQLREELESARQDYLACRYPHQLAREVLSQRLRWRSRMFMGAMGFGAVAAAAVSALVLIQPLIQSGPSQSSDRTSLVQAMQLPTKIELRLPSLDDLTGLPVNLSLREIAPSFDPEELKLPSLSNLF